MIKELLNFSPFGYGLFVFGVLFFCSGPFSALGQVEPSLGQVRQWYDKETIHMKGSNAYVKNNLLYAGSGNLKREFSISPTGMHLYLRSRRNRGIATVISLAGAAGSITALLSGNRNRVKTFFWVGLGTGAVSGLLTTHANNQLNEAVWQRNRDAILLLDGKQP
jgi:hypothetical protein